ncbi:MAG TPA: hypothetical protein GXX29_14330 [Firmicutes bacterium]|nr:hypothetical protein [Bacillota bacterium]
MVSGEPSGVVGGVVRQVVWGVAGWRGGGEDMAMGGANFLPKCDRLTYFRRERRDSASAHLL